MPKTKLIQIDDRTWARVLRCTSPMSYPVEYYLAIEQMAPPEISGDTIVLTPHTDAERAALQEGAVLDALTESAAYVFGRSVTVQVATET